VKDGALQPERLAARAGAATGAVLSRRDHGIEKALCSAVLAE
jgi:hypothetical protein